MSTRRPVVTLDASLTIIQADKALAVYSPATAVAIRQSTAGGDRWYAFRVGELIDLLHGIDGTFSLTGALDLAGRAAAETRPPDDPLVRSGRFQGLVVSGRDAVAIAFDSTPVPEAAPTPEEPRRRSWTPPESGAETVAASPAAEGPRRRSWSPPESGAETVAASPAADEPRRRSWSPPEMEAEPPASPTRSGEARPGHDVKLHPRLDMPDRIDAGTEFEITVGVSSAALEGLSGGEMVVRTETEEFDLVLQLTADGFEFPAGIRHTLTVDRSDVDAGIITVPMKAPSVTEPTRGRVEVSYSYRGVPIGRAWREVVVGDPIDGFEPSAGSLPMDLTEERGPDLTVGIVEGITPGRYLWTFMSPHDVDLPSGQVVGPRIADPRSFALGHVKELSRLDGSELAPQTVTGISRMVSKVAPNEFWELLDQVWRVARADDRPRPSLLMISDERYVPWELASTEPDWIDPDLIDGSAPEVLGAQIDMGRWLPAGPATPRGVARPTVPPQSDIVVEKLALVIGDYLAERGQRPLPMAKEEGDSLGQSYPSVRMGATAEDMRKLLADQITEDGAPVDIQVIHFACHGEVDPNNAAYNGIVLSDSALRLDHITVAGSEIGRNDQPMVFLNACQLAQDTGDLLGDYGGLAGAFLLEGCRGFIAPLWSVNDTAAKQTALDFYRMTLEEGLGAGEALRIIRGRAFNADTITPLAYVFYGHPELRLSLSNEEVVVDLRTETHADTGRN